MPYKNAESRRKYRLSEEGRMRILLTAAKQRAKKGELVFELDLEWLAAKLASGKCEMSNLKFSFEAPRKGYHHNPYSPSIDRHNPKLGYTKKNSKVVVTAYNIAKNQWNMKHFRRIIKAIYRGLFNE